MGIPHPFDGLRGSLLRDERLAVLGDRVDWVERHNARVIGQGNQRAAEFAIDRGIPGVAVSDAHSILEVGVAYTKLEGDPSTAAGLLAALANLAGAQLVPGRASLVVRAWTPLAKAVQRSRGNRRVQPARRHTAASDRGDIG